MIILSSLYGSLLTIQLLKSFLFLDIQNKKCRRHQVRVYVSSLMLRVFVCVIEPHSMFMGY